MKFHVISIGWTKKKRGKKKIMKNTLGQPEKAKNVWYRPSLKNTIQLVNLLKEDPFFY